VGLEKRREALFERSHQSFRGEENKLKEIKV